jgi:uncharacterized protein
MTEPIEYLTGFGRALRDSGLSVGSGRIVDFCRAASKLESEDLYWIGRVTLIGQRRDIPVYDAVFRAFFGDERSTPGRVPPDTSPPAVRAGTAGVMANSTGGDDDEQRELGLASSLELLRRKSFSKCTHEELQQLFAASERLIVPTRHSRRYHSAHVGIPDFRRTLRASFRTAGEPLERAWRARRDKPRRVVLLLDVSGSMAMYSRALLFFAHAGVRAQSRWEAFCFATRLTHVTRALARGSPDEALAQAASQVIDWDGGTRIGECLQTFLGANGHSRLARGAIVVICSDGLERGDPEVLGHQMDRLSRLAHSVVWLNPCKEDPAYAPLARGMRAALQYIDIFASGHNLASLEQIGETLARTARLRNPRHVRLARVAHPVRPQQGRRDPDPAPPACCALAPGQGTVRGAKSLSRSLLNWASSGGRR